jgi:hypothetical protein
MQTQRLRKGLIAATIAVIVCILTLAVVEGLSSLTLFTRDVLLARSRALPSFMQPDTLLGWINIPNTRLLNVYGPGNNVTINSRAFRGTQEYDSIRPPDKLRILCSGDSFTFGVGNSDHQNWCARLQDQDARLQTVNLGHGGWGIDQAYLFYHRDGLKLSHDVHVFAFIPDDFWRTTWTMYTGYPKPRFLIENGQLALTNVPVRRPNRLALWISSGKLAEMRFVQLGTRILNRVFDRPPAAAPTTTVADVREVALRLIENLDRTSRQNGTTVVFVLLAERQTVYREERRLHEFLASELARRNLPFIDLWSAFQKLPAEQLSGLFDNRWKHYSVAGNDLVATEIYRRLRALPEIANRLGRTASD